VPIWLGQCQFCGITALQYEACSGNSSTVESVTRAKRGFGSRLCSHSQEQCHL